MSAKTREITFTCKTLEALYLMSSTIDRYEVISYTYRMLNVFFVVCLAESTRRFCLTGIGRKYFANCSGTRRSFQEMHHSSIKELHFATWLFALHRVNKKLSLLTNLYNDSGM